MAILAILVISALCAYFQPTYFSLIKNNPLLHHNAESIQIDESWEDYLEDCGGEQVLENYVHAKIVFNERYENNAVSWDGYLYEAKEKNEKLMGLLNNERYLTLLIKMEPSESQILPDLVLSVSTNEYKANKNVYDNLRPGDGIDFDAIMVSLGNEFKMHELRAKSVKKNGQSRKFNDIEVKESSFS